MPGGGSADTFDVSILARLARKRFVDEPQQVMIYDAPRQHTCIDGKSGLSLGSHHGLALIASLA